MGMAEARWLAKSHSIKPGTPSNSQPFIAIQTSEVNFAGSVGDGNGVCVQATPAAQRLVLIHSITNPDFPGTDHINLTGKKIPRMLQALREAFPCFW